MLEKKTVLESALNSAQCNRNTFSYFRHEVFLLQVKGKISIFPYVYSIIRHQKNNTKIENLFLKLRSKFYTDFKTVLVFVLASIVFAFYNFEISFKRKGPEYENRNFLEKYFWNQKMIKKKTPNFQFYIWNQQISLGSVHK